MTISYFVAWQIIRNDLANLMIFFLRTVAVILGDRQLHFDVNYVRSAVLSVIT